MDAETYLKSGGFDKSLVSIELLKGISPDAIRRIEQRYSRYRDDSIIARINTKHGINQIMPRTFVAEIDFETIVEEGEEIKRAGVHAVFGEIEMGAAAHFINQDQMARQRIRHVRRQFVTVIADDGLEAYGDAQVVEHLRDVKRVGVGLLGRQQLAADGNDGGR